MPGDISRILITSDQIQQRIREMAAEIETADPEGGGLTAAVATLPAMGFGTWKFLWHMPVCCDPAFCRFSKPCLKKFVARSG